MPSRSAVVCASGSRPPPGRSRHGDGGPRSGRRSWTGKPVCRVGSRRSSRQPLCEADRPMLQEAEFCQGNLKGSRSSEGAAAVATCGGRGGRSSSPPLSTFPVQSGRLSGVTVTEIVRQDSIGLEIPVQSGTRQPAPSGPAHPWRLRPTPDMAAYQAYGVAVRVRPAFPLHAGGCRRLLPEAEAAVTFPSGGAKPIDAGHPVARCGAVRGLRLAGVASPRW